MSSLALKIIAIAAMLLDHIGFLGQMGLGFNHPLAPMFETMRCLGRMAMPLFVFMAAESCAHTRSITKYMRSLLIFALISEIPFDIFVNGAGKIMQYNPPSVYSFGSQNVFFTLLLGVLAVYFYQKIINTKLKYFAFIPAVLLAMLAEVMNSDYGYIGVIGVFLVYIMPNKYLKIAAVALVPLLSRWDMPVEMLCGLIAVVLVFFYNGRRGRNIKWLFYWFYPMHLAFLAMLWVAFIGKYF